MGKMIESSAKSRKHTIVGKIDPYLDLDFEFKTHVDVAIEFSTPNSAVKNIKLCLEKGIPILSGTTGWLEHKKEIEQFCKLKNGAFFYSSNYSIGVNKFFKLNENLASMMNNLNDYEVEIKEIHHTEKKDAPSGTAITLAEGILKYLSRKKKWVNMVSNNDEDLVIHSERKDSYFGTHSVTYRSDIDEIEIKHTAHSRIGFANGAIMVAEWFQKQKGVLGMQDYFNSFQ